MLLPADRLQHIFDSLDYHVAMYDREWRYTYVNAAAARMLGRDIDALLGRCIWDLFPEAIGNQYYCELHEAAATGRVIHSDHFYPPFDGWFENHIYPQPDGVVVLARNVTRERRAAEALRRREQMLRLAQRAGGVATFEWDFRTGQAQCSAEFFRMFGLPEREGTMTGAEWGAYVHPADRDRMAGHLARALNGEEPAAADYRIEAADGRTRWLSYTGQLQPTAEGARMIGTVVDITDRVEAQQHASRLAAVLEATTDVVAMATPDGRLTYLNGAGRRMLGLGDQPDVASLEDLCPAWVRERMRTEWMPIAMEHGAAFGEGALLTTAGDELPVSLVLVVHRNPDRKMEYLSIIARDISERTRLEAELRQHAEELAAANRLKDEFLATLSHELRTPLNVVRGRLRMLTAAPDVQGVARAVEVIERNSLMLENLVGDLLDVARLSRGQLTLQREPVDVAGVVQAAIQAVQPLADARQVQVAANVGPDLPALMGDSTRLQQVVWNLLSNAVKFTPSGGRVALDVSTDGLEVVIAVSDTGVGIPAEALPRVFDRFWQADASAARRFGGLGLGLSIARRLVELHGGAIAAESAGADRGSTFVVRLPAAASERSTLEAT